MVGRHYCIITIHTVKRKQNTQFSTISISTPHILAGEQFNQHLAAKGSIRNSLLGIHASPDLRSSWDLRGLCLFRVFGCVHGLLDVFGVFPVQESEPCTSKETEEGDAAEMLRQVFEPAVCELRQVWGFFEREHESTWPMSTLQQADNRLLTCASFQRALTRKPALLMLRLRSTAEARDRILPLSLPAKRSSTQQGANEVSSAGNVMNNPADAVGRLEM